MVQAAHRPQGDSVLCHQPSCGDPDTLPPGFAGGYLVFKMLPALLTSHKSVCFSNLKMQVL